MSAFLESRMGEVERLLIVELVDVYVDFASGIQDQWKKLTRGDADCWDEDEFEFRLEAMNAVIDAMVDHGSDTVCFLSLNSFLIDRVNPDGTAFFYERAAIWTAKDIDWSADSIKALRVECGIADNVEDTAAREKIDKYVSEWMLKKFPFTGKLESESTT